MTHVHVFRSLTAVNRPQDLTLDGSSLRFETMDHGGQFSDRFPNAVKVTDSEGRWCVYTPIQAAGQEVQSLGFFSTDGDDVLSLQLAVESLLTHGEPTGAPGAGATGAAITGATGTTGTE
jgi:hypothetical protein